MYCPAEKSNRPPQGFVTAVTLFGNPEAKAPCEWGDERRYTVCWNDDWLVVRLYKQYKYARELAKGKKPPRNWFLSWDDNQDPKDWKTTAMRVMNAEFAGNATYEWFDFKEDENGERKMYRVNQFDRIEDTSDPRLNNPALDYLFNHLDMTFCSAWRAYRNTLSEKKN